MPVLAGPVLLLAAAGGDSVVKGWAGASTGASQAPAADIQRLSLWRVPVGSLPPRGQRAGDLCRGAGAASQGFDWPDALCARTPAGFGRVC